MNICQFKSIPPPPQHRAILYYFVRLAEGRVYEYACHVFEAGHLSNCIVVEECLCGSSIVNNFLSFQCCSNMDGCNHRYYDAMNISTLHYHISSKPPLLINILPLLIQQDLYPEQIWRHAWHQSVPCITYALKMG